MLTNDPIESPSIACQCGNHVIGRTHGEARFQNYANIRSKHILEQWVSGSCKNKETTHVDCQLVTGSDKHNDCQASHHPLPLIVYTYFQLPMGQCIISATTATCKS